MAFQFATGAVRPARQFPCAAMIALLCIATGLLGSGGARAADAASAADSAPAATGPAAPMPTEVHQLLDLMKSNAVQAWIAGETRPAEDGTAAASPPPGGDDPVSARVEQLRTHLAGLVAAARGWPQEVAAWAGRFSAIARTVGPAAMVAHLLLPFLLGAAAEWLSYLVFSRFRLPVPSPGTEGARWIAPAQWLTVRVGGLLVFTATGLLTFMALKPPQPVGGIVALYFAAAVVLRLIRVLVQVLLAPGPDQEGRMERLIPLDDESARFWAQRSVLFAGWYLFGYATIAGLTGSMSAMTRRLDGDVLALGLVAIAIEAVVRRPCAAGTGRVRHRLGSTAGVVMVAALWCLWVAGMTAVFKTLLLLSLLPFAISLSAAAVANVARRTVSGRALPLGVTAVLVGRGIRSLLIIVAILGIARAWGIALADLSDTASLMTRVARSTMNVIVIYLGADLIWQLARAAIDARLSGEDGPPIGNDEAARRRHRMFTMLLILRNVLFIVVVVVAVLMELAAVGIDIAPLIAGAGVVGVAIGFGAQTVVKDIISGMFYLLDDAFRVGEYIQSGSYKGTVESFSLRSIKLRHHRGPIYTVPFGMLGAVQNMSRDWVVVKLTMRVTYGTDLEKARKLVKRIGTEMMADQELAASFLQPLKMQGVEEFDEYGIKIRVKLMARPGEQFTIRRKALANIKQVFESNGIEFAVPRVQVTGGEGDGHVAAAQSAVARQHGVAQADQPS